jgi:hypothetical protein
MKTEHILIARPKTNEQFIALKAFMEALKINFETTEDKPYDPAFVEKLIESRRQAEEGKTTRVKKENLKEFLGI